MAYIYDWNMKGMIREIKENTKVTRNDEVKLKELKVIKKKCTKKKGIQELKGLWGTKEK